MATLDVYQVTMRQQYLGQTLINTFFYQQLETTGVTNWATILLQGFRELFDTQAGAVAFDNAGFSNDLQLFGFDVKNLFNPAEISVLLIGGTVQGAATGTNDAPYVAYRLAMARGRGDMRNGQKYFGGVPNGASVDGIVNATILGFLADLQDACNSTIAYDSAGLVTEFQPVIVKRVREGAGTPADPYTYRLPANLDEYDGYLANNWIASDIITTSNRRKFGRGI